MTMWFQNLSQHKLCFFCISSRIFTLLKSIIPVFTTVLVLIWSKCCSYCIDHLSHLSLSCIQQMYTSIYRKVFFNSLKIHSQGLLENYPFCFHLSLANERLGKKKLVPKFKNQIHV